MSRPTTGTDVARAHRSFQALGRKVSNGAEGAPAPAARLHLAAMGASPATARDRARAKAKAPAPSPHISMGQFFRAAIVVCIACCAVAFPPPGLEKPGVSTAVAVGSNLVAIR
jgi:hypothetical protein